MPIKVIKNLPAITKLAQENIFVMDTERAENQQIRPLQILLVNLMPTKEVTETQILRALSNSPLQVNLTLLHTASRKAKNTDEQYLETFYRTFDEVKDQFFDGMIITGAPVELMPFEEVDYWSELVEIMNWGEEHVYSTFYICWGLKLVYIITLVLTNLLWMRNYSVFMNTIFIMIDQCSCVDLMKSFGCHILVTLQFLCNKLRKIVTWNFWLGLNQQVLLSFVV